MKVAVIGCGTMGRTHANNYAKMPGVELVGVCDQNLELATKLADPLILTSLFYERLN